MKKNLIVLVVASCIIGVAGCGDQYPSEKLLWKAGKIADKIVANPATASPQDFDRAIAAFNKVIEKYPESKGAGASQFRIGQLYLLKKDFNRAEREFATVLQKHSGDIALCAQAQLMIGGIYEQGGQWDKAVVEYTKIADNYQGTTQAFEIPLYIARHYDESKEEGKAKEAYSKAIRRYEAIKSKNPNSPVAVAAMQYTARAYEMQHKTDKARDTLREIADSYPKTGQGAAALYGIGLSLQERLAKVEEADRPKEAQKAIDVYNEFLSKYANSEQSVDVQFRIAGLYALQKNYTSSLEQLHKIIAAYPKQTELCARAQFTIGLVYQEQGKWDIAEKELRKVEQEYPKTVQALQVPIYIAGYYADKKQDAVASREYQRAITVYQTLIKKYPKSRIGLVARELVARAYGGQKQWDKAIAELETLRRDYPKDESSVVALYSIGLIYEEMKQNDHAVSTFTKFLQEYPGHQLTTQAKDRIKSLSSGSSSKSSSGKR
jgi:TolA-binding protein